MSCPPQNRDGPNARIEGQGAAGHLQTVGNRMVNRRTVMSAASHLGPRSPISRVLLHVRERLRHAAVEDVHIQLNQADVFISLCAVEPNVVRRSEPEIPLLRIQRH